MRIILILVMVISVAMSAYGQINQDSISKPQAQAQDQPSPESKVVSFLEPIQSTITFILGFLTAVFADPFRQWWLRPKVSVYFEDEYGEGTRCISKTPDPKIPDEKDDPTEQAYYVRALIKNKSRTLAKSCRAFLTKIEIKKEEGTYRTIHEDPLPLAWSFVGYSPIDVPAKMQFFFDVFSSNSLENRLIPQTSYKPVIWKTLIADSAYYRFTITVVGENVTPVSTTICVDWRSQWDTFKMVSG